MEDSLNFYDLIIIGGGPAGLSAAIYGGRAKLKTLLINFPCSRMMDRRIVSMDQE